MAEAGRYLFAGLSGAGNSIAGGLDARAAMQERAEEEQKQRAQRTSKLTVALDTMGILPKDVGVTKSLEELEGLAEGVMGRMKLGAAMEEQAQAQRQAELQKAFQEGFQGFMADHTAGGPPTEEMLRGALLAGAERTGDPRLLMEAMRAGGQQESPLGFGKEDVIDLGKIDPRLEGQFQVRQSRGSFQNLNTTPRATGGLPFKERVELMDRADLQKRRQAITSALGKYVPPEQVALLTQELQAINDRLSATEGNPGNEAGKSPYPEGTRLRGKDGKLYVVRNGKPELE